ncbi:DUF192 domain-containing protein [Pseudalkalibacillus hwajinpoensis]|uniref:DUF192 domain-containing protein n=1 Tax=Guptibacillus hwajinpoensis TaxID=208199 RepID=UPI001CD4123F|nr:DUF192 domain-containing protein [Pseudalkalibacillus hwajinpoensis]MCA0989690.1 DUF192 domain-containing protein [Pseudalkalibacillus hwajinpoensis]
MIPTNKSALYRTLPLTISKANTFGKRLKGLMFRTRPLHDEALLITPCNAIHMCFMFFSIDVVFLNERNEVVKVVPNLKPWRIVLPVKGANATLELPAGAIERYEMKVGDYLNI